jgi:hypothetical protein
MLRLALVAVLLALPAAVAKKHLTPWQAPVVVVQVGEQRTATTLQFATAAAALALKFENQPSVKLHAGFRVRVAIVCLRE